MCPKTLECSICGLEFAIGQALSGYMRRYRASNINENNMNNFNNTMSCSVIVLSLDY
ncbi:two zinc finger transport-like protein, putative [Medicago truncatula]|uniref:Two zinc finger transport-like protein, putative n=1 Tax=Medicago truncatula TaxID=3880 RepID=G7KFN8_MEDTR|nr:two zinc finger transport-like protein, putative [Medicago truncatula]